MYSDLFDHLGGGAGSSGDGTRDRDRDSNDKSLVSFKAGKCEMTLQENGKYWITPDTRRGEIRIVWKDSDNALYWEWYDRREKMVSDRYLLTAPSPASSSNNESKDGNEGTFERLVDAGKEPDRIVLWTRPSSRSSSNEAEYHMFWMQDASEEKDDEIIAEVNQYLADPASGNPNATTGSGSGGSGSANRTSDTGGSTSGDVSTSSSERQVDALSNILENLGMPQSDSTPTSATNTNAADSNAASSSSANAPAAGTLTLADLQGAMASLQQQNSNTGTGLMEAAVAAQAALTSPPLQELVTPEAINSILENEEVTSQLLELLPEDQRSMEYLEDNLRSPQVQQTLRTLTSALLPDDTGSLEGFHSVLANFQLQGANEALVANNNNPILAFLECVQKKVEAEKKEKEDSEEETKKNEEKK